MKDVQQQNRSEITRGVVVVSKSFGKEGGIVCERKRDGEGQEVYRTYLKSGLSFSCSVERSKIE